MSRSHRSYARVYEREILARDGPAHVDGIYYGVHADAERRWAALRMLREAFRRAGATEHPGLPAVEATRVTTWLTPRERVRVQVALCGAFMVYHRSTLAAVGADLALGLANAAILSVALVRPPTALEVASLGRAFPAARMVGLIAEAAEAQVVTGTLLFGQAGIGVVVDGRVADGWTHLRSALRACPRRVG